MDIQTKMLVVFIIVLIWLLFMSTTSNVLNEFFSKKRRRGVFVIFTVIYIAIASVGYDTVSQEIVESKIQEERLETISKEISSILALSSYIEIQEFNQQQEIFNINHYQNVIEVLNSKGERILYYNSSSEEVFYETNTIEVESFYESFKIFSN